MANEILDAKKLSDDAWAFAEASCFQEANAAFALLCELWPHDAEAWMMHGTMLAALGKPEDALVCLCKAQSLAPDFADPYLHMGRLSFEAGSLDDALRLAGRALALDADYAEAWLLKGACQAIKQQYESTIDSAKYTLRLAPGNAQAKELLIQALIGYAAEKMSERSFAEAVTAYQEMLRYRPNDSGGHNNLGNAYLAMGDMVNAEVCYRKALELPDALPEVFANLGLVLQSKGELSEAVASYEKALSGKPESAALHQQMALGLQSLGHYEEAIAHCEKALGYDPDSEQALAGKADILQKQGQYLQSRDLLQPLVDSGRANCNTILVFAQAEARVGETDRAIGMLEALLKRDSVSRNEHQQIHAGLGSLCDKRGLYDQAFAHFQQSNSCKQGRFDPNKHEAYVSRLIAVYTPELLAARAGSTSSTGLPVFIVGMPRSGTSLVEQILASHPAVFGAGELEDIRKVSQALSTHYQPVAYPECMNLSGFDVLKNLAAGYLAHLRSLSSVATRVTDKMPHNFLHLGLIQVLFPGARVIHVNRDPLDTCLSCYFQEFSTSHSYAYDLTLLGEYYRQYERLMAHWRNVLSLPLLDVRYEDLVGNQAGTSRRMIEFCGLEWDDRVLRFHETRRNVATPSFEQVRQPMYTQSVERWKNYEAHLAPLVAALK